MLSDGIKPLSVSGGTISFGPCDRCGKAARALYAIVDPPLMLALCIGCWASAVAEGPADEQ